MTRTDVTRLLAVLGLLAGIVVLAGAQESPSAKTGSITGTVIKEPGSEPLKKVLVQVVAEDQKQGGIYSASTDGDGRFHIENVSPGRYSIFFERNGFVEVNARGRKADVNALSVQPGQALNDLLFHMLATAVITGRITDEDGDPMAQVTILVEKKSPGKASRKSVGSVPTDDLGQFRVAGLFPGQYWITAQPPPDARDFEHHSEKAAGTDAGKAASEDTRYLTTYYPGTFDSLQASAITLRAGEEMPVNMTLVPSRTFRVRGMVTGLAPSQKPTVELVSRSGEAVHAGEVAPDGRFEVRGVGPGSYVVRAYTGNDAQTLTARQDITVVSGDVEGVKLAPQPSFTISGHLRVESNRPINPVQYSVNLRPAEMAAETGPFISSELFGANAAIDRAGNMQWKNITPGGYYVQVFGGEDRAAYLKSVTLGGRDASTGFTASGPATIDIVISTMGGKIQGIVVDREKDVDQDHPVPDATVVAVPEEKYRKVPGRFVIGSSDQQGKFTLSALPPGTYTLYAWLDPEDEVWLDAGFLKMQEPYGTPVTVSDSSEQSVQLKPTPIAEEWQ